MVCERENVFLGLMTLKSPRPVKLTASLLLNKLWSRSGLLPRLCNSWMCRALISSSSLRTAPFIRYPKAGLCRVSVASWWIGVVGGWGQVWLG
ncbi:hypothetical protein [Moraxella lacunata]|uniref:hypothetical protein n=1 Tax=Moraxella lacunata TaxID=477 RepID=UPI003EE037BE